MYALTNEVKVALPVPAPLPLHFRMNFAVVLVIDGQVSKTSLSTTYARGLGNWI